MDIKKIYIYICEDVCVISRLTSMKGFLYCRAFRSADGTLRKSIQDYFNTESIFPLTVHLAWLEISESAQEMSLYATYCLSSSPPTVIYSATTPLLQAVRSSGPTDSPAVSALVLQHMWCFSLVVFSSLRSVYPLRPKSSSLSPQRLA